MFLLKASDMNLHEVDMMTLRNPALQSYKYMITCDLKCP